MEESQTAEERAEWLACAESPAYFIQKFCWIFNATEKDWVPFDLWDMQHDTLESIASNILSVILKARQLGLSWLVLCYVLWCMIFQSAATVLLFSKRDDEAIDLLNARLKGIYKRLPGYMQAKSVLVDSNHDWVLSNGSSAKAFPTTGGRSYTGSIVVIDEADFIENLDGLLNAVKPTIDAGGQMIMLSSVDKSQPNSAFKRIYKGAKTGRTTWNSIFLPWYSRPFRDAAWYEAQKADILERTTALDDLHQEYPATDTEALAPRSLDKRIPALWIERNYVEETGGLPDGAPSIPGLVIYRQPEPRRVYVIGIDPAEGNPTSDDSALTVLDVMTGEEVSVLSGKYQPSVIAGHTDSVGTYYNSAGLMVERNNHGHAVILWLHEHSKLKRLLGRDGKDGWVSSTLGKTLMYNETADAFSANTTTLHSFATYTQLASIEGSTLRAPEGENDDLADSYALAHVGRSAMMLDTSNFRVIPQSVSLFGGRAKAGTNQREGIYGSRR